MIEIVLAVVAIVGCVVFAITALRMTRTTTAQPKKKNKKTKNPKKNAKSEIPKEWRKNNPAGSNPSRTWKPTFPKIGEPRKIRIPGLRLAKRLLAGIMTITNFFIMCSTLLSHQTTQPLFWLFAFNFFVLLDYLWKTGKGEI